MMTGDTIAAVATPPGAGALAVVRLSGSRAREIAQRCAGGHRLEPRRATLVRVRDAAGAILDEAVATFFAAPASFTGEDTVEFSCHGGMLVTQRVLQALLDGGARPAEAGEFSRRAFENGRLDLTQAEAIMDVISAGSELALRAAQNQLQGAIGRQVEAAIEELLDTSAHLTAYVDFPEEDIEPASRAALEAGVEAVEERLQRLLKTADTGRFLREGIRTALVGPPNVGKSSLLNLLLGYERAIVSETAGTTRDTIEESVCIGGFCLRLIDTAGLRESQDELERAGMERSRRAGASADLLLEVADASSAPVENLLPPTGARRLLILNKCDLPEHPAWAGTEALRLSCRTGEGRKELEEALSRLFLEIPEEGDTLAAINTRHRHALQEALGALVRAKESLHAGEAPELTDIDLREALEALGSITGRVDTEDVLERVFSTFCLGK